MVQEVEEASCRGNSVGDVEVAVVETSEDSAVWGVKQSEEGPEYTGLENPSPEPLKRAFVPVGILFALLDPVHRSGNQLVARRLTLPLYLPLVSADCHMQSCHCSALDKVNHYLNLISRLTKPRRSLVRRSESDRSVRLKYLAGYKLKAMGLLSVSSPMLN